MLWKPSSPSFTRKPDTVVVATFISSITITITMVVVAMMFFFVVAVKLYAISFRDLREEDYEAPE
jgi:hypothetical protein